MKQNVNSQLRAVIVDDHFVVRRGIRAILDQPKFQIVGETGDLDEAPDLLAALRPELLIIDLQFGDRLCIQSLPELRDSSPETRILVLSMHESVRYAREALAAGADGYVRKEAAAEELIVAISSVISGQVYLDAVLGGALAQPERSTTAARLTPRECDVLALIAVGHTNKEVGRKLHLSLRTIESHRASLKTKLGLSDRSQLTEFARSHRLID